MQHLLDSDFNLFSHFIIVLVTIELDYSHVLTLLGQFLDFKGGFAFTVGFGLEGFLPILIVTFAFLIAFPTLFLRTILYFLTLTDLLKVFFLAVNLGVTFLTLKIRIWIHQDNRQGTLKKNKHISMN